MSDAHYATQPSVARQALDATRHCLTGCAIGEVVGLLISGALGLSTEASVVAGIVLAFVFGYSLTFVPLLRGGTFAVAFPVNRWLMARGRGHAVAHGAHG